MDNDINKKIKIKIEVKFLKCELKVKINSLKSFDDEFVKYSFNTFVKNATRMYHVAKFQNLKERFLTKTWFGKIIEPKTKLAKWVTEV